MPDGINITYIQEETTASDLIQLDEGFYTLSDTPSSPPASGDYHYFASPVGNAIQFKLLEASGIDIDTSGLNYTGSDLLEYLSNLDTAVNNNAAGGGGDPTTTSTVEATGAVMNGDFTTNGLMRRTGQDSYDVVTNGIDTLTSSEVDQLKNIDSQTISNTQWGYVGSLDQDVSTSSNPSFNSVNSLSLAEQSTSFTVAGGSGTTRTLTVDEDATLSNKLTQVQDDSNATLGSDLNLNGKEFNDTNSNKITGFTTTGSAVNNLGIANASTGNTPEFYAEGNDSDIGVNLSSKGNGNLQFNGTGVTQNQWDNYLATTDQAITTSSDVNFNTVSVTDLATTKSNLNLDNVPNEDATNPYNLDQKGAADGQVLTWDGGNSRWEPQSNSGSGSAIELDLSDDGAAQSTDLQEIATTNDTNSIFANPTGDKLLIDASKNWPTADDVPDSAVDHNQTTNYVSNEHIDHSGVSISAGTGLSGGGDITSSRTLNLNAATSDLTDAASPNATAAGQLLIYDSTDAQFENATLTGGTGITVDNADASITLAADEANIDHDSLQNYSSNEHVDHTSVSINAGSALTGGGDISSSRTLDVDITGLSSNSSADTSDEVLLNDASAGSNKRINIADLSSSFVFPENQVQQVLYEVTESESPYTIPSDATFISCDTSTGSITLQAQSGGAYDAYSLIAISDKDGNASTNNITIKDSGGGDIAIISSDNGIKYILDNSSSVIPL